MSEMKNGMELMEQVKDELGVYFKKKIQAAEVTYVL